MKLSPKWLCVAMVACAVAGLHAELTIWAGNTEAGSKLEAVFFRLVALPSGSISVRRPPKETRPELSKLITATPSDGELYSLRALESEQQLDFTAAEADWKKRIELVKDRGTARIALADFYHRRLKPREEFDALTLAATEPAPDADKLLPDSQQRAWKVNERLMKLIDDQRLDAALGVRPCANWISQYPKNVQVYRQCFEYSTARKIYPDADQIIARYQRAFPQDEEFPIEAHAELLSKTAAPARALALYEQNFKPSWPAQLVTRYFALMKQTNSLRVYLDRARAGVAANPTDLVSAVRLYDYWQQQNNLPAAERALAEFRLRKESRKSVWNAEELLTLGRLYEAAHDYDEAARNYYALYSVAGSDDSVAEHALGSLARMILSAPEQAIHFGSGNLSLYRDVATMDPHPGFLNGVLSLLLNNSDPADRAAQEEQNAAPYFRRERAAELVALFESRFPNSAERADLRERVIEAYAVYGSNDGVIRAGTKFLADFPNAENRTSVALRVGDAYARTNQTRLEFAIYDALLVELAKRADGMPVGALVQTAPRPKAVEGQTAEAAADNKYDAVRSPEYGRVLDRYVARLVSLKRVRDALAIYRREIDRNPNDAGLYDILAAFLEQNKLGSDVEQTYQRAMAQFPDHTWEHKLARWYLRQRRQADVARITQDVVKIFSGTELDAYFQDVVHPAAPVGPALYLQLNLYAHQRFPHHLGFVRNLLGAYSATATRNDVASMTLLREHWLDADDLRMRFFERLSRTGRLGAELAAVRTGAATTGDRWAPAEDRNPAAVRTLAEGEAWRGHFEAAAPIFFAIEDSYPADAVIGNRTVAIYRSLGTIAPKMTDTAIATGEKLAEANPRDAHVLTRLGEMEADREMFDKASLYWNRIPAIEPAKPDAYLEAATIFWDYYRYDDALRTIEAARLQFAAPGMFAYESGAILENEHEYNRAVREYARGAIDQLASNPQGGSNAERRLLALARRPELRADVELLTSNLVSGRDPSMGAYRLRVALLRNQGRRDDIEAFLITAAGRTNSPDLLAAIENDGRLDALAHAQEAAITRQIAITTDPVERMRLRLSLARFYEGGQQIAQGTQVVDVLYRENPAILGVVRAAVDHHWRNKNTKRAIDVLEESAGRADAGYRAQFTLEAARKSIDSGDYARARAFATRLLTAEPYRAEYIAVMADAYARAGDDRALRAFYDAKIRELSTAAIGPAQRTEQIAAMRRALIPVLTRAKDVSAALDQYIEVLNRYPEDDSLAREAAIYASQNGVTQKLRDYYAKAASDSPKDYRWPMVLARIATQLEDFPAAIAAYSRAAEVRPDRADLLSSRLNLEERLLRFDEAGATAEKLYLLTYRNPDWMVKLAAIRARQGRTADAIVALQKAWIEGRSANARAYFDIARTLEAWGALADARRFAEQGMRRLTADNRDQLQAGVQLYARILARMRAYEAAPPDVIAEGVSQIATVAGTYYSPDEKTKYAAWAQTRPRAAQGIALVQSAGMGDVEAKLRFQSLIAAPAAPTAEANKQALVQLQKQRLAFDELGSQLEAFDRALPPGAAHGDDLMEAATAYRAAGNAAAELRVLQAQNGRDPLQGPSMDRYCQLLLAQPQRLVASTTTNAIANYAMEHSTGAITQRAIAARGQKLGPLWTNAYTALTGLYFTTNTPQVRSAFTKILGDMSIGARIGKPVDRTRQLAGEPWFYYGGRYGEYLGVLKQAGADDFLASMVEAAPQQSQPYFEVAEYFRDAGDNAAAAVDYRNALQLRENRADAHDRLALIAASQGRPDEAIREWKLAITALADTLNRGPAPPKFWIDANDVLRHVGDAKLLAPLREDLDKLVRAYVHRNGSYQVDPLLEGMMAATGDAAAGVEWIAEISRVAPDPTQFLAAIVDRSWIPEPQRNSIYARMIESAQAKVAAKFGEERGYAQGELSLRQIEWAKYLIDHRDAVRAQEIVAALPQDRRDSPNVVAIRIRAAARTGKLAAMLASMDESTASSTLRMAATELAKDGDAASERRVLEFVYSGELKAGKFDASSFLGLAEIRITENDVAGAVALLRRAALLSGEAFSTLEPSAALLEKTGHAAEAAQFLSDLVTAEPWNHDSKERLAAARGSAGMLTSVATSADAPYSTRTAAALVLRKLKATALVGADAELVLLSSQTALTAAEVSKPYWVASRLESAAATRDAATRVTLLTGAIAINPAAADKFSLFRAALDARKDALAIAIATQITPMPVDAEFAPWIADQFISNLPLPDRVAIARRLSETHQRNGDLRSALLYDQIAQHLGPADGQLPLFPTIRTQLDLFIRNNARRPIVTDNLDQDRLVHPKVIGR